MTAVRYRGVLIARLVARYLVRCVLRLLKSRPHIGERQVALGDEIEISAHPDLVPHQYALGAKDGDERR